MAGLQMGRVEVADRVTERIIWAVLVLALPIILFMCLSWLALGPTFLPALLGQDHFLLGKGKGMSMYPLIVHGDYLIVDTTPELIEVGDIIVFVYNDEFVGHRIIKIVEEGYITKGDNNPAPDLLVVYPSKVIGEVDHIIRDDIFKKMAELWFERYD